jgi:hypothetical protein
MANSRRESHHRNGITDPQGLQQTSATKSVTSDRIAAWQVTRQGQSHHFAAQKRSESFYARSDR